jgi:hypothetical protein
MQHGQYSLRRAQLGWPAAPPCHAASGGASTCLPKQELFTVQLAKQAMGSLFSTQVTAQTTRQVWHAGEQKSWRLPRCPASPSSSASSWFWSSRSSARPSGGGDARDGRAMSDAMHRSSRQAAATFRAAEEAIANLGQRSFSPYSRTNVYGSSWSLLEHPKMDLNVLAHNVLHISYY